MKINELARTLSKLQTELKDMGAFGGCFVDNISGNVSVMMKNENLPKEGKVFIKKVNGHDYYEKTVLLEGVEFFAWLTPEEYEKEMGE